MISYLVSVLTLGVIFCIIALALNVRYGWTGELDVSLFAFVAIGAYVSGVTTLPPSNFAPPSHYILGLQLPFVIGVIFAMTTCGFASLIVGGIALRAQRDYYFSMTTLATALILFAVISQQVYIFNGFIGLYNLPQPFNSALNLGPDDYSSFYLAMCLLVLGAVYLFLERLYSSPFGRALRSGRDNELAARAFGRDVYWLKLTGYIIGGVIAGLGGALLAHFLSAFNPQAWTTAEVFLLYSAMFLGGVGNQRGVVLGTLIVTVLIVEVSRNLPQTPGESGPALRQIFIALLIIAVLRFRPRGILPEPRAKDTEVGSSGPLKRIWSRIR